MLIKCQLINARYDLQKFCKILIYILICHYLYIKTAPQESTAQ